MLFYREQEVSFKEENCGRKGNWEYNKPTSKTPHKYLIIDSTNNLKFIYDSPF